MDGATAVAAGPGDPRSSRTGCPRCGEPWSPIPAAATPRFGDGGLRRCRRCANLFLLAEQGTPRLIRFCRLCALPFPAEDGEGGEDGDCADCGRGATLQGLGDDQLVVAAEAELRAAVSEAWPFVGSPKVTGYLNRIARQVARAMGGPSDQARVALFRDGVLATLALPSGRIVASVSAISALEDESELVFVLAHEWAHIVSGDARRTLVPLALASLERHETQPNDGAWAEAARNAINVGYGLEREQTADARALEVVVELGYDPRSVLRYLRRLEEQVDAADTALLPLVTAHPAPRIRRRAVETTLAARVADVEATRVNREVFRRAVGHGRLASQLRPIDGLEIEQALEHTRVRRAAAGSRLLWTVAGIALLALTFLLAGFLLSR